MAPAEAGRQMTGKSAFMRVCVILLRFEIITSFLKNGYKNTENNIMRILERMTK